MKIHELRCDPQPFGEILAQKKKFELRKNDRMFNEGDLLHLRETVLSRAELDHIGGKVEYTGREIVASVLSVLHGPVYGIAEGWVVMSISPLVADMPKA